MTKCKCRFWGENRADEYFFDVGCVLGYAFCKGSKCEDYQKIEKKRC